ncbi:MAG: hypothetical protein HOK61_07025 [Alphaproteobacteria bacterium]|nr:hypothetical protein [Alphaproteobacteria bacterium]
MAEWKNRFGNKTLANKVASRENRFNRVIARGLSLNCRRKSIRQYTWAKMAGAMGQQFGHYQTDKSGKLGTTTIRDIRRLPLDLAFKSGTAAKGRNNGTTT